MYAGIKSLKASFYNAAEKSVILIFYIELRQYYWQLQIN